MVECYGISSGPMLFGPIFMCFLHALCNATNFYYTPLFDNQKTSGLIFHNSISYILELHYLSNMGLSGCVHINILCVILVISMDNYLLIGGVHFSLEIQTSLQTTCFN